MNIFANGWYGTLSKVAPEELADYVAGHQPQEAKDIEQAIVAMRTWLDRFYEGLVGEEDEE